MGIIVVVANAYLLLAKHSTYVTSLNLTTQWDVYHYCFTNEQIVFMILWTIRFIRSKDGDSNCVVFILLVALFYMRHFEHTHTHTSVNKYLLATIRMFLEHGLLKLAPVKHLACGTCADESQQPDTSCACQTFK